MLLFYKTHLKKVTGKAPPEWGGRKACPGRTLINRTKLQHWKYLRGKRGCKGVGRTRNPGSLPAHFFLWSPFNHCPTPNPNPSGEVTADGNVG